MMGTSRKFGKSPCAGSEAGFELTRELSLHWGRGNSLPPVTGRALAIPILRTPILDCIRRPQPSKGAPSESLFKAA